MFLFMQESTDFSILQLFMIHQKLSLFVFIFSPFDCSDDPIHLLPKRFSSSLSIIEISHAVRKFPSYSYLTVDDSGFRFMGFYESSADQDFLHYPATSRP